MERGGHCDFNLRGAGLLMNTDDLCRARGIDGANSLRSFETLAADDQAVLHAQVSGNMVECTAHGALILRITEVSKRLIRKHSLRRARPDGGRDACDCHNEFSLDQMTAERNEGNLRLG